MHGQCRPRLLLPVGEKEFPTPIRLIRDCPARPRGAPSISPMADQPPSDAEIELRL